MTILRHTVIALGLAPWALGATLALGFEFEPRSHAVPADLPSCEQEDGNADGAPCLWTDADTGRTFYVDSANYRLDVYNT